MSKSAWQDFLEQAQTYLRDLGTDEADRPGKVMICFVNRFLEGMDGIKYKLVCDGKEHTGKTTTQQYCVELAPRTTRPIKVWVWSRQRQQFKQIDDVIPVLGQPLLVRKQLRTVKVEGKTAPRPKLPAPALAPAKASPQRRPAPPPGPTPQDKQGVQTETGRDETGHAMLIVQRPTPEDITPEQLKKIYPAAALAYLQQIADELNVDLAKFKLDTAVRRAHFFGQIRQESGSAIQGQVESLNYSPEGLKATFGYYKKNPDEAKKDGRITEVVTDPVTKTKKTVVKQAANQEAIANKAYGNKLENNRVQGGGWLYRGRGFKQLTGYVNYKDFSDEYPKYWSAQIDFTEKPELLESFPYTLRSAVWFWLKNKCYAAADGGIEDTYIDAVTKIVNAGELVNHQKGAYKGRLNPVECRRKYTKLAYDAFK